MNVKNSNLEVKRKFLLFDILFRINQGEAPYDIQKRYGWPRQRLNYWTNKLKKSGLIQLRTRSTIAIYELTLEGKNFYTEYINFFNNGIRLHNVSFTYPLIKEGSLAPEKEWELKGLIHKLKRDSNASVVWNHKSLTISISSLVGSNAFDLFNRAKNIADGLARKLRETYFFELNPGYLSRKPHYAILNPLINQISKHIQLSTEDAKIDQSEGSGELEFFDPGKVERFIKMPEVINQLQEHLIKQDEILEEFSKNIALHLTVLQELRDAIKILGGDKNGEKISN